MISFHREVPPGVAFVAADFFEGWPNPPGQDRFAAAIEGSYAVEVAVVDTAVVGFVNAISDGVTTAFIPWLEVVPAYRGQGVGHELMRRIVGRLWNAYSIDLVCDPGLVPFYRDLGMAEITGMGLRFPGRLSG